ncbi:D-tyrosyl-tRNA(Tyr) deacylase [Thelotrema lepadinum]|nr:D-tyrosyl-tRNA(Tyr) deacylase [Thelotrema lepadinum]
MAIKVLKMRIWPDSNGVNWKRSVSEMEGEVLCISQFTLLASTKKGSKPDFHGAAGKDQARALYEHFVKKVRDNYRPDRVKDGVFQAMMDVALVNDGPVTLEVETNPPPAQTSDNKKNSKPKANGSVENTPATAKGEEI